MEVLSEYIFSLVNFVFFFLVKNVEPFAAFFHEATNKEVLDLLRLLWKCFVSVQVHVLQHQFSIAWLMPLKIKPNGLRGWLHSSVPGLSVNAPPSQDKLYFIILTSAVAGQITLNLLCYIKRYVLQDWPQLLALVSGTLLCDAACLVRFN